MRSLADAIAEEMGRWQLSAVEEAIFGTKDPLVIARHIEQFCCDHLHSSVESCLFYRGSAGCAFGVQLSNSERAVIKAYQSRWTRPFLEAVQSMQRRLVTDGFPCPAPILEPLELEDRSDILVTADTWVPDPGMRPFSNRRELVASASALAEQVRLCRCAGADSSGLEEHPLRQKGGTLYPEPHSPLFDFAATADGAEWIDSIAAKARSIREADTAGNVVAHTDWSARNVRIADQQVVAAYDWDSLAFVTESVAAGQAAMTWRITSEPGDPDFPGSDEVAAYLRAYEKATGRVMSSTEWHSATAAAVYVLAYTARCEHALMVSGIARRDQHSGSERLRSDGDRLLNIGRV